MFVIKQVTHGSTIKREDGNHVGTIKLQERLVKHHWIWLILDQLDDIRLSLAHEKTLEK